MTEQKKKIYATIVDEYGVVDSGIIPAMLCTGEYYLIIDVEPLSTVATNFPYVFNDKAPEGISEQEKFFKMKEQRQFRKMCKRGR